MRWVGLEMLNSRSSETSETLLHIAARTNNAAAVHELTSIWANPLLRDRNGMLAVD